jgi:hypothetical protein
VNYSIRRFFATWTGTTLSLTFFILILWKFDLRAQQFPYQPQDPVITVIPSQTIGLPVPRIDNVKQQRVYNQLLSNYSLLNKKNEGDRAKALFETILAQIGSPLVLEAVFGGCKPGPALLIHVAIWHVEPFGLTDGKTPRTFVLTHSEWHGYQWQPNLDNILGKCALKAAERPDGSPSFVGAKCIYFFGINAFDSQMYGSRVTVDYKLSELPQLPINLSDLSTALSAVTGVQLSAPSGSTSLPSAPTPIDNGWNGYQGTSQSTVMVNLSQATLPTSPLTVRSLLPTSAAPYTINPTFFLQFQPSPLLVTQGVKLGKPDAAANAGTPGNTGGGGQNDTSLYLNDHLEQLLPQISKPSITHPLPTEGRPVPLTLGPLPPGLTFESDAELAYEQFAAQHQPIPTSGPAQLHGDALKALAATQKFEAVALLSAMEASQAAQTLTTLSKIPPQGLFVTKPALPMVDPCCAVANPGIAAPQPASVRVQTSPGGDACSPATPPALAQMPIIQHPDDDADVDFISSPLHQYLDTVCHQALAAATDATSDLDKENSEAQGSLSDGQKRLVEAQLAQTKSTNELADAQAHVDKENQQVRDDANLLQAANDGLQNDKAQLCSVDYQHDALPQPSPNRSDPGAIEGQPPPVPMSGTNATTVRVNPAAWALDDGCGPAPTMPNVVVAPAQSPAAVANTEAPSSHVAPPNTSESQQAQQQIEVHRSLVQQSLEQAPDLDRQRTQLKASRQIDLDLVNQRTIQQGKDMDTLRTAQANLSTKMTQKAAADAAVAQARMDVKDQSAIADSLHSGVAVVKSAQTYAISTESPHQNAERLAQCAIIELRVARYVSESGQRPAKFTESLASLQACQNYVATLTQNVPASANLLSASQPRNANPQGAMGCVPTGQKLRIPAELVVQWAKDAPKSRSEKDLLLLAKAVLEDVTTASSQAACYIRDIDERVSLINSLTAASQKNEVALDTADPPKAPVASPNCTANTCCCCCAHSSPAATATKQPQPSDPLPTGGALRGTSFRAGDFPLVLTLHSASTPYIRPIRSDPQSASDRSDSNQANSCVLPTELAYGANDIPCVGFVPLTSVASSSGGGAGSPSGGGKGGQGNAGNGNGGGGGSTSAALAPVQAVDCSRQSSASAPCAYSRSFMVDEPEWWDISLGLSVPGVREKTYTIAPLSSSSKPTGNCLNNTVTCGVKHHADAYALLDLYPFATNWFATLHGRRALFQNDAFLIPHLNLGIPITSQSLYRPYFGAAVNVSSPLQHRGFPIGISVFAGLVDMKQTICNNACAQAVAASATATPILTQDRALRGAFGVEVSITAIAGKLKGGASGGGASKSGSSH